MPALGRRVGRTWTATEIERVALGVRRQIWPDVGLLEAIEVGRLAVVPHTVVGPRGRIQVLLVHNRSLPRHRWLETEAVEDGVLIHANTASWTELNEAPRTRFGVAHELGHAVLHTPRLRDFTAGAAPIERNDPVEREANRFAAHLLCPDAALAAAERSGLDCSPDAIAERWGMGLTAARARLCEVEVSDS